MLPRSSARPCKFISLKNSLIFLGLPLEHPFETIKTRAQSELKLASLRAVRIKLE